MSLQECYNFLEILKISQNMREKRIPFADPPQRPNRIFAYTQTPQDSQISSLLSIIAKHSKNIYKGGKGVKKAQNLVYLENG